MLLLACPPSDSDCSTLGWNDAISQDMVHGAFA